MEEIHGISEGSTVRVTDTSGGPTTVGNLKVGQDEIVAWLTEGVELEVTSIKEKIGRSPGVMVKFAPASDDMSSHRTIVARTYESWPNGCSGGHCFDADGHITKFADKYFDVEELSDSTES